MLLVRADGNAQIGAGHLMRCLTVAEEWKSLYSRDRVIFVCADKASADLVSEYGHDTCILGTDYRDMETELRAWGQVLETFSAAMRRKRPVILVDSYFVTDRYLEALRKWGYVALMDDQGSRCYPADCVINYNAPADPAKYSQLYHGKNVRLLIGKEYLPIRRQFRGRDYQIRESVKRVLITAGGGDPENIAGRILERLYVPEMEFYLVTGKFNPHLQALYSLADTLEQKAGFPFCSVSDGQKTESGGRVHICYDVKDMAGLMEQCDMAITAGGSTIYELAAMGVPFICFSCAGNQEALTTYIKKYKIAGAAGAWHEDAESTLARIASLFWLFVKEKERRCAAGRKEQSMADCLGAARLAEALGQYM